MESYRQARSLIPTATKRVGIFRCGNVQEKVQKKHLMTTHFLSGSRHHQPDPRNRSAAAAVTPPSRATASERAPALVRPLSTNTAKPQRSAGAKLSQP